VGHSVHRFINCPMLLLLLLLLQPAASSLGLVSPGAATNGVTLLSPKKNWRPILVIATKWWPFLAVVSSQLPSDVVLSSVLCKFSHKIFLFIRVSRLWMASPKAVRSRPSSPQWRHWLQPVLHVLFSLWVFDLRHGLRWIFQRFAVYLWRDEHLCTCAWCRLDRAAQHKLDIDCRNKQHAQLIDERMHRLGTQSIELTYHDDIEYHDDTSV